MPEDDQTQEYKELESIDYQIVADFLDANIEEFAEYIAANFSEVEGADSGCAAQAILDALYAKVEET